MGTDKTSLGDRMKLYEKVHRIPLMPRSPVLLRLDGVAFHTLTRGFERPMDLRMSRAMNAAAVALCKRIQGSCFAYCQSDEISVLIVDYKKYTTQPWFDKQLQKMVSVSAGIASSVFTTHLREVEEVNKIGAFDSRVIVLPKDEVINCFIWRQQDCIRNSIQALGQANFSHKQLMHKDTTMIREMLLEKDIDWDECPTYQKQGFLIKRVVRQEEGVNPKTKETETCIRSAWVAEGAPLFMEQETRDFVDNFVYPDPPEEKEE